MNASTTASTSLPMGIVRALRPRQWIKNVLVFAAPVAAGIFDSSEYVVRSLLAFVCFCAASSATYLVNDALDVESDRNHPTKRNRPIAAGVVPVRLAWVLAVVLLVASVTGAFALRRDFGLTIVAYLVNTTLYSLWLKRQPVLDIVSVAAGFVLRAIGGATATDLPISEWFFIVTSFGALFMVAGKRAGELSELGDDAARVRPVFASYSAEFLTYLRAVFSAGVLITYCLWAFASADESPPGAALFELSIVPFAIAILRYALLLQQGRGSEPETLVLSDATLLAAGAAWAIIYGCAVYAS